MKKIKALYEHKQLMRIPHLVLNRRRKTHLFATQWFIIWQKRLTAPSQRLHSAFIDTKQKPPSPPSTWRALPATAMPAAPAPPLQMHLHPLPSPQDTVALHFAALQQKDFCTSCHTSACVRKYMCVCVCVYLCVCVCVCMCVCVYCRTLPRSTLLRSRRTSALLAYVYISISIYPHYICIHVYIHINISTLPRSTLLRSSWRTSAHTYIHTYIHIHIHI